VLANKFRKKLSTFLGKNVLDAVFGHFKSPKRLLGLLPKLR
jgi:hypothetical protein